MLTRDLLTAPKFFHAAPGVFPPVSVKNTESAQSLLPQAPTTWEKFSGGASFSKSIFRATSFLSRPALPEIPAAALALSAALLITPRNAYAMGPLAPEILYGIYSGIPIAITALTYYLARRRYKQLPPPPPPAPEKIDETTIENKSDTNHKEDNPPLPRVLESIPEISPRASVPEDLKIENGKLTDTQLGKIGNLAGLPVREAVDASLFRRYLPANTEHVIGRLARALPRFEFQNIDRAIHHGSGSRIDGRKLVMDEALPVPTGRVMWRRTAPGDVDVGMVIASDISSSITSGGGKDASIKTTAVSMQFNEILNTEYGEIVFGHRYKWLKPLGKRLGNELEKNRHVQGKIEAFEDPEINNGTNIHEAFAAGLAGLSEKNYRLKLLVLITDGAHGSNFWSDQIPAKLKGKNLQELRSIAIAHGIHPIVIAIADAQKYIPQAFEPHEYRFAKFDDDIPTLITEMVEEIKKRGLHLRHPSRKLGR